MSGLRTRLANEIVRLSYGRAARPFAGSLSQPMVSQEVVLRGILYHNAASRYGRQHGFAKLSSIAAFRAAVPIVDYDVLLPWIEAIRAGETGVLTCEPVEMFEKSSGSTAASKYIPYTSGLRREFQAATSPWLHDLYTRRPKLRQLEAYWSISPMSREPEVTAGGLRVGIEDDTEYFGTLARWVLGSILRVPGAVRHVPGLPACRYVTLRHLLDRPGLGLISVWNPSFLTLLVEDVTPNAERLIRDLRAGTLSPLAPMPSPLLSGLSRGLSRRPGLADLLESRLRHGEPVLGSDLWPELQLISCWTDGVAARALPAMRALFPGVEVQGKGLLATEGVVTIPLLGHPGGVVALRSHFFEFVPEGGGDPVLVDELALGQRYTVLLTTAGGLYRYALHDLVEVVGHAEATPLLVFVGKAAKVSDLVGEKLNERHVGDVVTAATATRATRFAMLAPAWGEPPHYDLLLESEEADAGWLTGVAQAVEAGLRDNPHYAYARDLGQLGAVAVAPVLAGAEGRYLASCVAMGHRAGDVKPTYLHAAFGWRERLTGAATEGSAHGHAGRSGR